MRIRIVRIAQGVALGAAVLAFDTANAPASAQSDPPEMSVLIELAQNNAMQDVISLPGAQLAEVLGGATEAERLALVAALPPAAVDTMMIAMLQARASNGVIADLIGAIIENDPADTQRIIDVILDNTAPAERPAIAAALYDRIDRLFSEAAVEISDAVLENTIFTAVTLDTRVADRFAQLGNRLSEDRSTALAAALARISETADDAVASAVETAVAREGGQFAQRFGVARGEVDVAVTPPVAPPPVAIPDVPAVPPAGIGGPGTAPGAAPATGAGRDAIFAQGASSGTGVGAGPSMRPSAPSGDVSPP